MLLLKSILNRIMPLVAGGTYFTGVILIYFFGFLFSIIVNSIIWLLIGTFLYRYYWRINVLEEIIILYILGILLNLKRRLPVKFYK